MSSALAVCEQPEKVHPGGATRSASRSSLAQVSKLAAPTPMAVGDSADSGTAEETVPQENQGSLKQSSSLSHIFDNVFGKVSNSVQNAKDYSETAVGIKNGASSVAGGASIGPGGVFVYTSPLSQAAKSGSAATVEALLKAGVDPNAGSTVGLGILSAYSALAESALKGDLATVETLLRAGADPNLGVRYGPFGLCSQYTPLAGAANGGFTEIVRALIKAGADPSSGVHIGPVGPLIAQYTPLGRACRNGHTGTMLALLEAGADPNVGLSLGPFGTIGSYSLLGHASAHGNTEAVRALLKAGAKPDEGLSFGPLGTLASFTPLEHAARNGHTECVMALIEAGADPDKGFAVGPFGIFAHANPLVHAAANGHSDAVEALISAGAAPAGVYPWSHLDPASGCSPTQRKGGEGKLPRTKSVVHVVDETGLVSISMELAPGQVATAELHTKLAEKEQLLEDLREEQKALKQELHRERKLSVVLREGDSLSNSPAAGSPRVHRAEGSDDAGEADREGGAGGGAGAGGGRQRRASLGPGEGPESPADALDEVVMP